MGGVGQRTEEVEDRGDAELAPRHRSGVPQRGVIERREQEADADPVDDLLLLLGREVEHDAQRLEHISGTAGRRGRAVAVLDHPGTRRRGDDRRHRGDVDRVRSVTAGADDVDRGPADLDRRRELDHHVGEAGQLLDRLALAPQADDERSRAEPESRRRPGSARIAQAAASAG